jgi:YacP-like NYN domain
MRWLIDGYNVIRRDPALSSRETESLDAGRAALLHVVAAVARTSPDTFTVVFDGARRAGGMASGGRVEVIFSRPTMPMTCSFVWRRAGGRGRSSSVQIAPCRIRRAAPAPRSSAPRNSSLPSRRRRARILAATRRRR